MAELTQNYLTFRVGQQWYGTDISKVIEVTYLVMLTEVPASTPDMLGLMTVRDEVMPVIDLRRRFQTGDTALRLDLPIICLRTSNGPVGLVADEAVDVVGLAQAQVMKYEAHDSPYVEGVLRLNSDLIMQIDAARIRFEVDEEDLILEDDIVQDDDSEAEAEAEEATADEPEAAEAE